MRLSNYYIFMEVRTLTNKDVEEHCRKLLNAVLADGFSPDAIIGIRTGGADISSKMYDLTGGASDIFYAESIVSRGATRRKKSFLKNKVSRLPRLLQNLLRIAEAKVAFRLKSRARVSEVCFTEPVPTDIKRILLVDDAVDSGATAKAVVAELKTRIPEAEIRTAVFTVTTAHPEIYPNYYIYNKGVLLRFPWSMDA